MLVSLITLGILLPVLLIIGIWKGHDVSPLELIIAITPAGLLIWVLFFKLVEVL